MVFLHFGHFGGVPLTILSHTAAASSGFLLSFCTDLSLYLLKDISGSISVHLPLRTRLGYIETYFLFENGNILMKKTAKYSLFFASS